MSSRSSRQGRPVASSIPGGIPSLRRFRPTEEQWKTIAATVNRETIPAPFRKVLTAGCNAYIQARAATHGAIATKDVLTRAKRAKAALDALRVELEPFRPDAGEALEWRELANVMIAVGEDNRLPPLQSVRDELVGLGHLLSATVARLEGRLERPIRAPTEGECRRAFIAHLMQDYEALSGKRASARKDAHDLGRFSPFIHFLASVWAALPESPQPLTTLSGWALKARTASGAHKGKKKATRLPEQ